LRPSSSERSTLCYGPGAAALEWRVIAAPYDVDIPEPYNLSIHRLLYLEEENVHVLLLHEIHPHFFFRFARREGFL
jgi:hypothetical protein